MKNYKTVQPLMLHVAKDAQKPLFMRRITGNREHSCAGDVSRYGVSNSGQSTTYRSSLIPLTSSSAVHEKKSTAKCRLLSAIKTEPSTLTEPLRHSQIEGTNYQPQPTAFHCMAHLKHTTLLPYSTI